MRARVQYKLGIIDLIESDLLVCLSPATTAGQAEVDTLLLKLASGMVSDKMDIPLRLACYGK